MTIWGNHSATQYPDLFHAEVAGRNAAEVVGDQDWLENTFIPTVAKRGAAIIEARGASSAASAASATIDHARDWVLGTPEGDWVSMAVRSDGSYGVPEGLISSFPVTTSRAATGRSSRASRSTTSPAPGSTPPSPSSPRSATPSRASASSEPPSYPERPARPVRSRRGVRVPSPSRCPEPLSRLDRPAVRWSAAQASGSPARGPRGHRSAARVQLDGADRDDQGQRRGRAG